MLLFASPFRPLTGTRTLLHKPYALPDAAHASLRRIAARRFSPASCEVTCTLATADP